MININNINVLSLFDGISGGNIALQRAGITVKNYYASEIDQYAIKIATKNYPNIIELGDIKTLNVDGLPNIDLLLGGSPCQGFSIAGKRMEFKDERSSLIKYYFNILEKLKPKYFLLENVYMSDKCEQYISDRLNIQPIKINSSIFSAQNRPRNYWTNIPQTKLITDENILLKDILINKVSSKYKLSDKMQAKLVKRGEGSVRYSLYNYNKAYRIMDINKKCVCLDTAQGGGRTPYVEINQDGTVRTDYTLKDTHIKHGARKLTPIECERLQTLPDNYTKSVSDSQRYKMIGNGWTIDVISYLLSNINILHSKSN